NKNTRPAGRVFLFYDYLWNPNVRYRERELGLEAGASPVELGVDDQQPALGDSGRGGEAERGVGCARYYPAAAEVARHLHLHDQGVRIAHDVESVASEDQAVAVGDRRAAQVDLCDLLRGGVHAEKLAGVGLDDDEVPAVGAGDDAVGVEARLVHERRAGEV